MRLTAGRLSLALGLFATAVLAGTVMLSSTNSGGVLAAGQGEGPQGDVRVEFSRDDVAQFAEFELYWLGDSFAGWDLNRIQREKRDLPPDVAEQIERQGQVPAGPDYVSTIYGTCDTSQGEGRCAPPLQIQVWDACNRNLSMYPDDMHLRELTVRGVPAATFGRGRLELYTGAVTVVIFAPNEEMAMRAADTLRPANGLARQESNDDLPTPAAGALAGDLAPCDASEGE